MLQVLIMELYAIVVFLCNWATDNMIAVIGTDLSTLDDIVPGLATGVEVMKAVSVLIIIFIGVGQITKMLTTPLREDMKAPSVANFIPRIALAIVATFTCVELIKWVLPYFDYFYDLIVNEGKMGISWGSQLQKFTEKLAGVSEGVSSKDTTLKIALGALISISGLLGINTADMVFQYVLAGIVLVILAINIGKLIFQAVQRYIYLGIMVYTSPLAMSTLASEETAGIFTQWLRMLFGQILMLILNGWSLMILFDTLSVQLINPTGTYSSFFIFILIIMLCKVFNNLEEMLNKIGIHVPQTGRMGFAEALMLREAIGGVMRAARGGSMFGGGGGNRTMRNASGALSPKGIVGGGINYKRPAGNMPIPNPLTSPGGVPNLSQKAVSKLSAGDSLTYSAYSNFSKKGASLSPEQVTQGMGLSGYIPRNQEVLGATVMQPLSYPTPEEIASDNFDIRQHMGHLQLTVREGNDSTGYIEKFTDLYMSPPAIFQGDEPTGVFNEDTMNVFQTLENVDLSHAKMGRDVFDNFCVYGDLTKGNKK